MSQCYLTVKRVGKQYASDSPGKQPTWSKWRSWKSFMLTFPTQTPKVLGAMTTIDSRMACSNPYDNLLLIFDVS